MYLLAFLNAYYLLPRLQHHRNLTISTEVWSRILSWAVLGVVVGGRLGYVLFYGLSTYLQNPLEIFAVWNGGMSSHGGFIGTALSFWYILRKEKIPFLAVADIAVVPIAIGLAFGRLGNFINLELYGTVTSLPWGIEIPGVEGLRHPTQIYALCKDLFIASLCFVALRRSIALQTGRVFSLFLILYGCLRFAIEFVRVPDHTLTHILNFTLTRGQLLTIPLVAIGVLLWVWCGQKESS